MNASGSYSTSVPLDLPTARGGLPVPVQIGYSDRGVGAAGRGWDVPLSYIRRDTTIVHRRPIGTANVSPEAREQVTLVLDGRALGLVRTASGWTARRDAPDLDVRQLNATTWVVYDGQGRTYTFVAASAALTSVGMWLLQDITGAAGSRVHLDYSVTTPTVAGNSALAIDLARVRYNQHPTVADCYKTTISLAYDGDVDPPLAAAALGPTLFVRKHKLTQLDVLSKESCTSSDARQRRWQLSYAPDADTQQPRLSRVTLSGRDGTPEGGTPTLVASYTYGSASTGGQLSYRSIPEDAHDAGGGFGGLERVVYGAPVVPGTGDGLYTTNLLADVTGDGRADVVSYSTAGSLGINVGRSATGSWAFSDNRRLSDSTLPSLQPEWRSTQKPPDGTTAVVYDQVWRQAIDVDGDGRVDIVDAGAEAGYWVVYLSTPNPTDLGDPEGVHWVKRKYSIDTLRGLLVSRGLATQADSFLPLARRAVGGVGLQAECWQWVAFDPRAAGGNVTRPTGSWQFVPNPPAGCIPSEPPLHNNIMTVWEMKDLNGDGYPDVAFSSSPAVLVRSIISDGRTPTGTPGALAAVIVAQSLLQQAGTANKIEAVFGVLGTHLTEGGSQPFSAPVTLSSQEPCGVEQMVVDSPGVQHIQCGLTDVNGDGIVDRFEATWVRPGLGSIASGSYFSSGVMLTLPGSLAVTSSNQLSACSPGARFTARQTAGLIDVNGDGIPDYVAPGNTQGTWSVSLGTGTGFALPLVASASSLSLPVTSEDCAGAIASTVAGMVDLDGDGKPEFWNGGFYSLVGPDGSVGAPSAGRLVQIDSLLGARTTIAYRSIKGDVSVHRVPFAEIVVDSVGVTGTTKRGGDLSRTTYAYGGAELLFDPALDRFTFPGYRRSVVFQSPLDASLMTGTVTITDSYAPASALNPYGIATSNTPSASQRYMQSLRFGRVSDVTVLSGAFGAGAGWDPKLLLGIDVTSDSRRIAASHYQWDARRLSAASDPAGPEPCVESVYPYEYDASVTFASGHDHFDPCTAHGFAYTASVQSWRGAPGDATTRVESRSEVTGIDDFGSILSIKNSNDLHHAEDDVCMIVEYATPIGSNERVLSAASSRTISDCGSTVYAKDLWEYDQLTAPQVSGGLVTSHTVERHDDTGALIGTIRKFDTTYDASGNPQTVTTTREDGATRTVTAAYNDAFHLAISGLTIEASGLPTTQMSFARDPLTLLATHVTDPNGTKRGATFDGFDRRILETVTPPGGSERALAVNAYKGFPGHEDDLGPRIGHTIFTDPVDFATALAAAAATPPPARTTTVFLDELGREYLSQFSLGAKYDNQTLNVARRYDGLGRIAFEADPYPSTQTFFTAYGTTSFYNMDGTLSCTVRGNGPQSAVPAATDESQQLYPTCVQRTFQDYTEVVTVQDASSYLSGSPQEGVKNISYLTAIGRVTTRSTLKGQDRLEHATYSYDRLGHMTGMTRYQDAAGAAKPVTWSWHYDSLGQLIELDEPGSVPRFNTYSDWGELVDVSRRQDSSQTGPPDHAHGLHVLATYDALGRIRHREQQNNGVTDPETINDYFYDQGVNTAPQVTPTNVLGRLAQATWPTGSVSFSYDELGRVNARVFMDTIGRSYIETHLFHGDGSPQKLNMFLPDTAYAKEQVTYGYDSAGRGDSVSYDAGSGAQTLYTASRIDAFGRVRDAHYGLAAFAADYADVGRRLLNQVTVSSMVGSRAISFAGYDPMGRERSRTETKNGGSTTTSSHTYDALGRLSSSLRTSGTTTLFNQQFTYDPLGNLLRQSDSAGGSGATTALSYLDADRDRICRVSFGTDNATDCNVTYDEVGSITSMPSANGTRHYSYLVDGNVRSIEDDRATAHFRYDAFGDVQELEVTTGSVPSIPDARNDQRYGDLFAWHTETTGTTRTPVLLRNVPGPEGILATRHGASGPWIFAFGEARGNRFFTDQSGNFVQDVDYQPFGKPTSTGAQPGGTLYSNWQWNGGDALAAFGVSQLGARIYDPAIGRFVSRDPLLIPRTAATTNPYAFADNDPINGSDPSGLCGQFIDRVECPKFEYEPRDAGEPTALAGSGFGHAEGGAAPRDDRPRPEFPTTVGPDYAEKVIQWQKDLLKWTQASQAAHAAEEGSHGFFGGLASGVWSGTKGMVNGMAHMVRHPIDTAAGLAHMVAHPVESAKAIGHAVYATASSCLSGDGKACGEIAVNIGAFALGGVALRAASKVAEIAEIGNFTKIAQVTEVAEAAEVVEGAGAAGRATGTIPELSNAAQRSVRSLEGRLAEHESKLAAYRENPFAFDNRGHLARNAARPEVQQRIIDGRIRHLEGEIRNFRQQLERIRSRSAEP